MGKIMKISKEKLIDIIEREFRTQLAQTDDKDNGTEIPWDLDDLSAAIRGLIGGDADFPIGDWGDEALNDAANSAARALLYPPQSRQNINKTYEVPIHRFYEKKDDN